MKERKSIPRSYVQRDIIRSLNSKKELTFTDMQKILNISRKTLSYHISKLKKENSIEYEKRGREKYYRLSKSISKISQRQNIIFTNNYLDHLIENSKIKNNYERIYESIERKLTTYFSFGIIKSIQNGENLFEGFDINILLYMIISPMYSKIIQDGDDSEIIDELNNMNWELFFKKTNEISKLNINQKNISDAYKELTKQYTDEIKELEKLINF